MASTLQDYPFDLSNGWTVKENYTVRFEKNYFKACVNLTHDIDVCIYFEKKTLSNKVSARMKVTIKTKNFQVHKEDVIIDIECGFSVIRKILKLSECLSKEKEKDLTFGEMFDLDLLVENDYIVTITTQLREVTMQFDQVYKRKRRKEKKAMILDNYGFKRIKVQQADIPWKCYQRFQLCDDDYDDAIYLTFQNCKDESLSGLKPTIDAFPSENGNYQKQIDDVVYGNNGFFERRYDDIKFWKAHVVWANPPYHEPTIKETFRIFKIRKIRGFLCISIWIRKTSKETYVHQQKYSWTRRLRNEARSVIKLENIARTKLARMNLLVLYFDFSSSS